MIVKVTPVRNVLIGKCSVKSDRIDMFINKVVTESAKINVFDVTDRKHKELTIMEINNRKHRMMINNKRYFICSIRKG